MVIGDAAPLDLPDRHAVDERFRRDERAVEIEGVIRRNDEVARRHVIRNRMSADQHRLHRVGPCMATRFDRAMSDPHHGRRPAAMQEDGVSLRQFLDRDATARRRNPGARGKTGIRTKRRQGRRHAIERNLVSILILYVIEYTLLRIEIYVSLSETAGNNEFQPVYIESLRIAIISAGAVAAAGRRARENRVVVNGAAARLNLPAVSDHPGDCVAFPGPADRQDGIPLAANDTDVLGVGDRGDRCRDRHVDRVCV